MENSHSPIVKNREIKSPLKILIFTTASPFHEITGGLAGGAEYALRSVAQNLAQRGHEVHYVTSIAEGKKLSKHKINDVTVHVFPSRFRLKKDSLLKFGFHILNAGVLFYDKQGFRKNILRSWVCRLSERMRYSKKDHPSVIYFENLQREIGFDIVHCYSSPPDVFIAERLRNKYSLPFTVRMGGRFYFNYFNSLNGEKKKEYQELFKNAFDNTRYFFFNSSSLLENSSQYFNDMKINFPKDRSEVLDIGIDIESLLSVLDHVHSIKPEGAKKRILCVGKFKEGSKRQDLLLKVLQKIKRGQSQISIEKIHVDFAGGGDLLPRHIEMAQSFGVFENCTFHNNVSKQKVCELLKSSDLFVLPTDFEGSSKALAEALLAQIPVLASNISANEELLTPSGGGLLFENTTEDLLLKIEYALSNKELMAEKAKKGFNFILENLDPKVQAQKYEEKFYNFIG